VDAKGGGYRSDLKEKKSDFIWKIMILSGNQ
jgi:hypothetical protein